MSITIPDLRIILILMMCFFPYLLNAVLTSNTGTFIVPSERSCVSYNPDYLCQTFFRFSLA